MVVNDCRFRHLIEPITSYPNNQTTSNTEFYSCMLDDPAYIAMQTKDPNVNTNATPPPYTGMRHPPTCPQGASCPTFPWEAPFRPDYTPPQNSGQSGSLKLTQCNWYLPQGNGLIGLHRCVVHAPASVAAYSLAIPSRSLQHGLVVTPHGVPAGSSGWCSTSSHRKCTSCLTSTQAVPQKCTQSWR